MTKSNGPRTEPWGTPQEEVCQEDRSVSHFTRKKRDDVIKCLQTLFHDAQYYFACITANMEEF